jgi:lysyl-tRNA synthetase class 1
MSDAGEGEARNAEDATALGGREEWGEGGPQRAFWAEAVADRVLARDPSEPIVVKGGISPSGVPHLGNVNEITRGYFVAEALRDRGCAVRQVFTTDDRDPLRSLPRTLATRSGELVDLGDVDAGVLGRNLGAPYTDVPDPFGCCDSYGDHFSELIADSARRLGIPIDVVSTTDLYESGRMDEVVGHVLADRERVREVLGPHLAKVDAEYVPFNPICAECGILTETVTAVDADAGTVEYRCTDIEAGGQTIEGCGHEGTATIREGKLPWRLEWPAQWQVLGVDVEPFGKDHAEGSWPSGTDLAEQVLGVEPPVALVYEWFTLDGRPFSSSEGHVVLVHDVLEVLEPEALRYFFAKDPNRARDFSVERLDQLVDEFDRLEGLYYGEETASDEEVARAEAAYPPTIRPTVAATFPEELEEDPVHALTDAGDRERLVARLDRFGRRARIPYTFAAVLGMFDDAALRAEVAHGQGHLPAAAPEWVRETALARVDLASAWARRTDNEFNYELERAEVPAVEFDPATERALEDLADFVAAGHDGAEIQGAIFETAKRHGVDVGEFFTAGYRLLFDEPDGPKLGPFLAKLDREFVVKRLRREA